MGFFSSLFGKKEQPKVAETPKVEKPVAAPVVEKPKEVVAEVKKEEVKVETKVEVKTEVKVEAKSSNTIKFKIDGKACEAKVGQYLVDAANENGIYIPTLCHMKGILPSASCRICQVKINGRFATACTTKVSSDLDDVSIENDTPAINAIRKAIVEVLFVEGNHFCPSCEKSGNCELQAMAYKYLMLVPRFPYAFPIRPVFADSPFLMIDSNRCILCKKCVRAIKVDGKHVFALQNRGHKLVINIDKEIAKTLDLATAQKAMDGCPVGAILRKEKGFDEAIGTRKYDLKPIGIDNLN